MQLRCLISFLLVATLGCTETPLSNVSVSGNFPGLAMAADDLIVSLNARSGSDDAKIGTFSQKGIHIVVDPDETMEPGEYRFLIEGEGRQIIASTERGAMNGVYDLIDRLGTKYIHPEQTFLPPADPDASFPSLPQDVQRPRFKKRGFHEHTQHPLPATDFLLVADEGEHRAMASRYIQWLSRNQQTQFSFMLLRTVDLETWIPYMKSIVSEAHVHGIEVGVVLGFVDEQQNSFRLIRNDDPEPAGVKIQNRLSSVLETGMDFLTFQIGASEFTKPDERSLMSWLDLARVHIQRNFPEVTAHTWIHITCDVLADDGSFYFHLPEKADPFVGAWVHTTMFYDLDHAAPVYECDNFNHQLDFIDRAVDTEDTRELTYFPETAWWLGFDNNVPLALPLTGWSRSWDINNILKGKRKQVDAHVTFTTGREWLYWQYDHYVAQAGWKDGYTWQDYLDDLPPLYGSAGEKTASVVSRWSSTQARYFYESNPELYFYVAGELPQDEVGEQLGILARRPKLSFSRVLNFNDEEFDTWHQDEFVPLTRMGEEHKALFAELPAQTNGSEMQQQLYSELLDTYRLYVQRIDHAIALYTGVIEARVWRQESLKETPNEAVRGDAMAKATEQLAKAQVITAAVKTTIEAGEARYRYDTELLAGQRPDNLTIYKFGYLADTRSALFWARRDTQLSTLIRLAFDESTDAWATPPSNLFEGNKQRIRVTNPQNPIAAGALKGFLPSLLIVTDDITDGATQLVLAQDANLNLKPDQRLDGETSTEASVAGTLSGDVFTSDIFEYPVVVRDMAGEPLTELLLSDTTLRIEFVESSATLAQLEATFSSELLVELIGQFTGTDPAASRNLIKQVYGLPDADPLPAALPLAINVPLTRVSL